MQYLFLTHDINDPYFNLASEEYLLKEKDGYFFYVWKNSPAVIVGVNQNALKEVNLGECERRNVKIVRRLTGGGAVYHDLNNLCYTVIAPKDSADDYFREFTEPVIQYLNSIGVKAEFSGRNDITVSGKKISGNAETFYKDRVLHHGTLLFKTDLDALSSVLMPNRFKTESKGINSIRKRVANISDYADISVGEFEKGLVGFLERGKQKYELTPEDIAAIEKLRAEKYSRYEWNIGSSPKCDNEFIEKFDFGVLEFRFSLENGKIVSASITGDFFSKKEIGDFVAKLIGREFKKEELEKVFARLSDYIVGADGGKVIERMFS